MSEQLLLQYYRERSFKKQSFLTVWMLNKAFVYCDVGLLTMLYALTCETNNIMYRRG